MPEITKRRVTMKSIVLNDAGDEVKVEAVDYVKPDILEAYVADARTKWQAVMVSDEPDAGPGGYEGQTFMPAALSGVGEDVTLPAIEKEKGTKR